MYLGAIEVMILYEMCPIFSELAKNFEEVYTLEEILTVDKDICVF
jgi:hypothetical protein